MREHIGFSFYYAVSADAIRQRHAMSVNIVICFPLNIHAVSLIYTCRRCGMYILSLCIYIVLNKWSIACNCIPVSLYHQCLAVFLLIHVLLCSFSCNVATGGSSLFIPSISSFSMPECNRLFLLCRCCSSLRSLRSRVPADRHHHCRGKARSPPFCISPQLPLPCPG